MTFRVVLRQLCCGGAGRDQLRRPQPSGENHLAKCGTERQQLEPKVWQTPLTTCQLPLDQHCLGEQVWAGLAQGCPGPSLKRCWLPVPTGETEWERSSATQHADSQPRSPRPPRWEEALGHGACRADLPHTWGRPAGTPAGTGLSMAATNFVQEMSLVGDRLLLKLQRLPQAEPVEIVAFSVILLFTGQLGLSDSPQCPWLFLGVPRQKRSRCLLWGTKKFLLVL
ncbi:small integral membrane protein 5 isoform X1 [Rousettus aegyptiacus]|uniref:small integral membrane protein 5 isoform X1 n=1 Tax=Rousettus aegyptiacus TaxID=9407 RepID=UPI00168D21F7|nr:small integral membrane protein 5 isoform X1 [Rousettus aegyptiacus]